MTITIDPGHTKPISPWIYGLNFYSENTNPPLHLTMDRDGGNRWTAYNWETNDSNSGSDWGPYSNDDYLSSSTVPAEAVRSFIAADQTLGMASLITVQMQGYVSADDDGLVNINDPNHLAAHFKQVVYRKSDQTTVPFTITPPASDAYVYMDEFVWTLDQKFSAKQIFAANAATPTFVSLDNEPELWNSTHLEIQGSTPISSDAYIAKTINLAKALKDQFGEITIFGPVHYGFMGPYNWQVETFPSGQWQWFTDKYLQRMKTASDGYGKRLVDVYDFHWYSEARDSSGNRVTTLTDSNLTADQIQAIAQSPRSLWDTTYKENSWVANDVLGGPIYMLGRLQAKIDSNWPGTKIAITEYGNGGDHNIAGTIAQADNLGIFGSRGVFAASLWPLGDCPYIFAGFRMFRAFDGIDANFGDISVPASSSNVAKVAVYASLDSANPDRAVFVAINRSTASQLVQLNGQALSGTAYIYRITAASAATQAQASEPISPVFVGQISIDGSSWQITLPALSVSTIEVR